MVQIPTYESQERLNPTPLDPKTASTLGGELVDASQGLKGFADTIKKLTNDRQTQKAETYLAQQHRQLYHTAMTDPDLDNLEEKISNQTDENIQKAADMIKDTGARNDFISKAQLDSERRNVPIYNLTYQRMSKDMKGSVLNANDQDFSDYLMMRDPGERNLIRQRIIDRTSDGVKKGYINKAWGDHYLNTHLNKADMDQVTSDMSIDAEGTYRELQKGKDGLYPTISDKFRQDQASKAQKMIEKQGLENNMIFAIAQNSAENQLIDKMSQGNLTQNDIIKATVTGINGIRVRPQFYKAATEALRDPFPEDSDDKKYLELYNQVTDPDVDPLQAKINVLSSRGLTPREKASLLNGALREDMDAGGKKKSLDQLINEGLKRNKDEILEANKVVQRNLADKRTLLGNIGLMFANHTKDEARQAQLMRDFMDKVSQSRKMEDMLGIAKQIIRGDALILNPQIANMPEKGGWMQDKITGAVVWCTPDGKCEEK